MPAVVCAGRAAVFREAIDVLTSRPRHQGVGQSQLVLKTRAVAEAPFSYLVGSSAIYLPTNYRGKRQQVVSLMSQAHMTGSVEMGYFSSR